MTDHRNENGKLHNYMWQLLNQAEIRLPGISQAALRAEFYDVMRFWFDETNSWQESINFILVPNVLDYPVVPDEGRIIRMIGVVDQNNVYQPATMPKLGTVSFQMNYIVSQQNANAQNQTLTVRVAKNVTAPFQNRGIPCFPADVVETWGHYLLDGLVGRAALQPKKSWSDPQIGLQHYQRFRDGIGRVRADTAKQNLMGGQAWAFPQTWRTRNQRGGVSVTGSPW